MSKLTAEGSISWKFVHDRQAVAFLDTATVEIKEDTDASGQMAIRISLLDKTDAKPKLTFDDTALEHRNQLGDPVFYFEAMEQLLQAAVRDAKGEEQILNNILDELNAKSDDVPF